MQTDTIFLFMQNIHPSFFYKWILFLLACGFVIFHVVIYSQIRSMDKIISQPASSSVLNFISLMFIAGGIGLCLFIFITQI